MAEKTQKTQYFVSIDDPAGFRKEIIAASNLILDSFKHHERYQQLTKEKLQRMDELRLLVAELRTLNKQMLSLLPKVHLRYKGVFPEEHALPGLAKGQLKKIELEIKAIETELQGLA